MEPKKFIDIFTKKDFRKEIIEDLRKEFEQYPYFSPLVTAYLLSLRLNDDPSFRNELIKYSHYISDRRKFIELLFEIEIIKEKLKDKLSPEEAERLEKEIYMRAKQKHEQIIHEIIEPKLDKLRKLALIAREEQTTETPETKKEQTKTKKAKEDITLNVTVSEATDSTATAETKTQDISSTTVNKKEPAGIDQAKQAQEPAKVESMTELTKAAPTLQPEKKDKTGAQPTKQKPEPEAEKAPSPQPQTPTESDETKKEKQSAVTIDDIFKKIEELKKQKLAAKDQFKQRVTTIDKHLDEQKSREEVTPVTKSQDKPETRTEKKEQSTQSLQTTKKTAETETDKKEQPSAEQIDKQEEVKHTSPEKTKQQAAHSKHAEEDNKTHPGKKQQKTEPEKIEKAVQAQQPEKLKEEIDFEEEEIIEFDMGEKTELQTAQPEEKTQKSETKEVRQQAETQQSGETTTIETKKPEKTTETTVSEPKTSKPKTTAKQSKEPAAEKLEPGKETSKKTKGSTSSEKKSAADRILEEIRRRREMKKQQEQLIDKFLQEQPSIDKTKKPTVEGDLSATATKEPDLVTERMARIYEMQGLYDKAIATYEKLILKFPEKSDYFAQKIEELKKKLK